MLNQFDTTQLVAVAAALGWASGLRLYLVLTIIGLTGYTGWVDLPAGLRLLQHPLVLGACSLMLFIEFFADKIPGLDTLWDLVHTAIRIPAGAALAAAVFGVDDAIVTAVAAVLGGTLAATAHTAKATTRAAVNTSPEPFSNIGVSLFEDGLVPAALWFAYAHPFAFLAVLGLTIVLMLVLIAVLSKFLIGLWRRLRGGPPVPLAATKG